MKREKKCLRSAAAEKSCRKRYKGFCLAAGLMLGVSAAGILSLGAADQYIFDNGDLLTAREEAELQEYLSEISEEYECSIIAATTNTFEKKGRQDYTDDFYFDQDLGYDGSEDGIILMVNLPEREFQYGTYGRAIDIFTDYVLEEIDDQVTPYLSSGDYAEAFETYAELAEGFLEESLSGRSYGGGSGYDDSSYGGASRYGGSSYEEHGRGQEGYQDYAYGSGDYRYSKNGNTTMRLGISFGVGLLVTVVVLVILFRQLKSVGTKNRAQEYIREGSFHVTRANDLFLYRTMSKRRIERDHGNGRGGGGGRSHTHTTSGGHRAGGRGGSF